jgi:succinate dehydrogenase/fumarate reductase-like Fe-S protein
MAPSKVTFRIRRFDPENGKGAYDRDYEIEPDPGATILKMLNRIRAEQDPTLAYRYSCGSARCSRARRRFPSMFETVWSTSARSAT